MARIALVCPAFYSHIRAFEVLAAELEERGHETLFILPDGAETMLQRPSSVAVTIPCSRDPEPSARRDHGGAGILGIFKAVSERADATDDFCRIAPQILGSKRVDAVIGDEFEPGAGLVAAYLGLPHISLAAALPIERDVAMPLPFLGWAYDPSESGLARNRGGELVGGFFMRRQRRVIAEWAERFGLGKRGDDVACLSPNLRLTQTVKGFDFPRMPGAKLTPVGPIRSASIARLTADERFAIDPDRPFVFASLGTMQGHRFKLFKTIASACDHVGAQLMIAHCGGLTEAQASELKADWVVDFADQRTMLNRADLCITHGGLNTVLDCLGAGTPMLALPIGYDQPGIGARIRHHAIGETIPAKRASRRKLITALSKLIEHRGAYERAIAPIRAEITHSGGAREAARLVDRLLGEAKATSLGGRYAAQKEPANDIEPLRSGLSASL